MNEEEQLPVIEFLTSTRAHGGAPVTHIETHLSHVFLAGGRAYKMMRAVRYDFVDFSTIEKRRAACINEIAVNRRTAPGMYLGVVGIYRRNGRLSWEAEGEPVDWAVEMKRFNADQQFDRLAAKGLLTPALVAPLADRIAEFHQTAERKPSHSPRDGVRDVIDRIGPDLIKQIGGEPASRWFHLAGEEHERRRPLLKARERHGWVRHCHGDLHLGNICVFEGEPTPFDAIEFSEDLANIDVLYDLAFLLMDLKRRGLPELAALVLSRYLSATRDYSGLALLPLFQSMRASVRAMVLSLPGRPDAERGDAQGYLALANAYLAQNVSSRLICVGGNSGSGKSSLSANLSLEFGLPGAAVVLQSDVVRKRIHGVSPNARLPESAYGKKDSEAVYRRMFRDAHRALKAGAVVILDATFLDPAERAAAAALAQKLGVPFDGFWLTAPRETLLQRVAKRKGDPSDATTAVLERQLAACEEPTDWRKIDASAGLSASLAQVRRALDQNKTNAG